ncbi:MAG: LysM peptidoglycan-binding domain-containing protein [Spirochaetales bacterium]|nr:LysM peptidoglycan-binding domain-containing protein [Spirochaetales bacterium]
MAGKSLSDKFIPFALRSKSIERGYYNKNKDFAEVMGLAVINALKSSNAVEMSKFGEMTTALESENGHTVRKIRFRPNEAFQKRISRRHKDRIRRAVIAKFRLRMAAAVAAFLLILCFVGYGIYRIFGADMMIAYKNAVVRHRLEQERRNHEKEEIYLAALARKQELEEQNRLARLAEEEERQRLAALAAEQDSDNSSDADASTDQQIVAYRHEDLDINQPNVYWSADKDLVVKVGGDNEETQDMEKGQYREEIVEYDGKLYKKLMYIIIEGDTLWDISFRFLDNAYRWPFIHNLNKYIIDPDFILPGDSLVIYTEMNE